MIAFAIFFLGVITGLSSVELLVGQDVASVELFLDHESVGELRQAPWRIDVDFGPAPEPHLLVAVAKDAMGRKTGEVQQWVNRSMRPAEVALVLEPGSGGRGRTVALSWRCAVAAMPIGVRLTLDGQPVPVAVPSRVALPDFVPEQVHFLRAELDFPEEITASAEIVFGGRHKDQAQTELTAVFPSVTKGSKLPAPAAMDGWLVLGSRSLRVVATEEGPAEVIVIVDSSARPALDLMAGLMTYRPRVRLRREQWLRIIWPYPERRWQPGHEYRLYPESGEAITWRGEDFLDFYSRQIRPVIERKDQHLANALAVGALSSAARDRRRAVVLLVGPDPVDRSELPLPGLNHYLRSLSVPLFVVSLDRKAAAAVPFGGTHLEGHTVGKLADAFETIGKTIERQRVVWVEGKHLPQRIELSPLARGLVRQ